MTCYKPTQGCGVYENRSCSECPYSKPPKVSTPSITTSLNAIETVCKICGEPFAVYNSRDTNQFCPECLNRLNKILYPEREQSNENYKT